MNFYGNIPYNPNMMTNMMPNINNSIIPNDIIYKINELEIKIKKLEQRINQLENTLNYNTQENEPDTSLYMI